MKQAFFSYMFVVCCYVGQSLCAASSFAADVPGGRMVTPVAQAERESGTRLEAPANARPPAAIDVDDLKPTLFKPIIELLESIRASQEEILDAAEKGGRSVDRTDEVLGAIRGLNERQITIKGWAEQKAAFEGLRSFLEGLRDRLENVATVGDVQEAVAGIDYPSPEFPEVDLTGLATEETLLAFGDRLPAVENIREISANVADLTARLDNIAAEVEKIDLDGEVETLRTRLKTAIILIAVLLGLFTIQALVFVARWLVSLTKAAQKKAVDARDEWFAKMMRNYETQSKSAA